MSAERGTSGTWVAKGADTSVEFDGERVRLRSRKLGGGSIDLPIGVIRSVELVPATFWWNGVIRFDVDGAEAPERRGIEGALVPNGRRAPLEKPNSLWFKRRHERAFIELSDAVRRAIDASAQ